MKVKSESEVSQLYLTLRDLMEGSLPGTSAMGFSKQESWGEVPFPSPKIVFINLYNKLLNQMVVLMAMMMYVNVFAKYNIF